MLATLANPDSAPTPANPGADAARRDWRPAALMARYQLVKLVGAAFFVVIFSGWLWLQWSNPIMRLVAGGLLLLTAWITGESAYTDAQRSRSRIALVNGQLEVTRPGKSGEKPALIPLASIAYAQWREDAYESAGVWLFASDASVLAHLDLDFVADQAEARALANWVRSTTNHPFEVRWPATE